MELYLVQHAAARSEQEDPLRSLTNDGTLTVTRMANLAKSVGIRVDAIWHSGKARAAQTAEILASAIAVSQGVLQREGLAPNDPIAPIAKELSSFNEDLMIVGHMPFLGKLASALIDGDESADIIAFQQGGVACLERDEDNIWRVKWMIIKELAP